MRTFFSILLALCGGLVLANLAEGYSQDHGDLNPILIWWLVFVAWISLVYLTWS